MARNERKRILTPDMFDLNAKGEVVIRDRELVSRVQGATRNEVPGEQGVRVSVVMAD